MTETAVPTRPRGSLSALRHRDFAVFWVAASISNAGSWMQAVAVPALVYDLTGKAAWLGYVSLATLLPAVFLSPYAGVLADRIPRRQILLTTQSVQMASALSLWLLYSSDRITPGLILALGFVTGIATGFQTAAWQSFVPLLVPPDELMNAVKLNSVQFTLARSIGPAFAGVVVKTFGVGAAIGTNAVTYALVITALVVSNPRIIPVASAATSVMTQMRSGASYVWRNQPLRLAVFLAFVTALCGQSLQHVAPAIADEVLGRESTDNAGLLVALGVGALVSWILSDRLGAHILRSQRMTAALFGYLVSALVIGATGLYWVGLIGYFIGGLAHFQGAVTLNTLIQGCVPDQMRGRAMSFYILGLLAGIPLGAYFLGGLGDALGMRTALFIDAGLFIALIAWLLVTGHLRLIDVDELPADESDIPLPTITTETAP